MIIHKIVHEYVCLLLLSGENSPPLVNINWIIKGDGERGGFSSHAMTTATGVAGGHSRLDRAVST